MSRLKIWCSSKTKVLPALAPVLKRTPSMIVSVVSQSDVVPYEQGDSIIFCMGDQAKTVLQPLGIIPKNRTTTSMRCQLWPLTGTDCNLMFSYSPGISEMDYGKHIDLLCDASMAARYALTGTLKPKLGNYKYVENFQDALEHVDQLYAANNYKPIECTLDLETVGLDPYRLPSDDHPGASIVTIQFTYEVGQADVVYFPSKAHEEAKFNNFDFMIELSEILNSPKISLGGANLKYDLHWLFRRAHVRCTNFKFDTTLVGSMLDENRSNGLDVHGKIYSAMGGYSDEFDLTIDKSRMDLAAAKDPEKFIDYAGGDTDVCLQVRKAMKIELLSDPAATAFYVNILHPAARAFEEIEQGGILVDKDAYNQLESDLNAEIDQLVAKAKRVLGGRLIAKHTDMEKRSGLNLTKASLLVDFMFSPSGLNLKPLICTEKTGAPSTAMDHLLLFQDVPEAKEFVGLLKDYASATKTLGTYVIGFQKHLRSDGRYHPSFWFFAGNKDAGDGGTVTGRLSAKDPAFQTIPKHTKWAKQLRRCYIAPPGMLMMERDYSQGELKVIACIANEDSMIDAYLNGRDLHASTSGNFAGYSYEEMMALKKADKEVYDALRQLGKAGNFGLIYGMGVNGFHTYAQVNYGVKDFTLADAEKFRNGFFETYPRLPEYHKEYKARAHKYGFVRSPLGRVRHLPLINSGMREISAMAERQSINSPVQATLSDMLLWSIAIAHKNGWNKECPAIGTVHDSTLNYIPADNFQKYADREMESMQNLPFHLVDWNPQLKFTSDCKVGLNMADLKEISCN